MPPALKDPAAVLPGEADILAAVVAAPADETPKLVYADWLDDHGDPARAAYLRAFVAALRTGDPLPPPKGCWKPWRDLVGATTVETAREYGFADRARAILSLSRPTITLTPAGQPDHSPATGASRFGGLPDLPPEVEWPRRTTGPIEAKPLTFLVQVNLADVTRSVVARELPPAGLIAVFYDLRDRGMGEHNEYQGVEADGWRFYYFPPDAPLARRPLPPGYGPGNRFDPYPLVLAEVLEPPVDAYGHGPALGLTDDELRSRYWFDFLDDDLLKGDRGHRLLGPTRGWEDDGLGPAGRNLLKLAPSSPPGWMESEYDSYNMHFNLTEADLRAGRLDRVRLVADYLGS